MRYINLRLTYLLMVVNIHMHNVMTHNRCKCIKAEINSNLGIPCAGATTGGRTITATGEVVCDTRM